MTDAEALAMTRLNYRRTIGYVLNVARFRGIEVVIYNRVIMPVEKFKELKKDELNRVVTTDFFRSVLFRKRNPINRENVSKFKRKKNDPGERILYLKRAYKGEERKRFYI